jgi:sensor histidine kinase YesM
MNNDEEKKTKRGWWFSVIFMGLVMGLIIFLARVEIIEKNRDVLIGILGMITGSISSMLAIASGRDPAEVDELRAEVAKLNADRAALIARLRDANIQLQLKNDHLLELQLAMIKALTKLEVNFVSEEVELHEQVKEWLPSVEKTESNS